MNRKLLEENTSRLNELESAAGYVFRDKSYLLNALTHSSFANEKKIEGLYSNERLEFLGDAVLNIVTSDYIFRNFPSLPEGEMTKTRASIVCESSLLKCASGIGLGDYLLLGKGEENTGGRTRPSILSDAFEALIGAIYLDGGLSEAAAFIRRSMGVMLSDAGNNYAFVDYKTQLQETVQKSGEQKINYSILDEKGPDHNKHFIAQVTIGGKVYGSGEGRNKKEAEQNAAKAALVELHRKQATDGK